MHGHLRRIDPGDFGGDVARQARHLGRRPDLDPAVGDARGAIHRLHRGVREIGCAVDALDVACGPGLRRGDVTTGVEGEAAAGRRRPPCRGLESVDDGAAVERAGRALLPGDRNRLGAAPGVPPGATDDGERGRRAGVRAEADDPLDAGQGERGADVDRAGAAAEHRAVAHRGKEQAGQADVDAEHRRAIALGRNVQARQRPADQLPLVGPLQLDVAARRRSGHRRELAVMGREARGMADDAIANDELVHRLLPGDRGGAEQARARGRGGKADDVPGVDDARRSAGDVDAELARDLRDHPLAGARFGRLVPWLGLARMEEGRARDHGRDVAVQPVGAGGDEAHPGERHVELLGREHRQRGMRALPHLAAVHRQQHRSVGADLDPAVQADLADDGGKRVGAAETVARRQDAPADDQGAGRGRAAQDEGASPHARIGLPCSSAAASRIAARMRGYVPQRQMLVTAASMSASLGPGVGGEERGRGHQHAALAVAALRYLVRDPRPLQRVRPLGAAERLDRDDPPAGDGRDRGDAGARRAAVDVHGAGAARGDAAAELRPGQAEQVTQRPQQGQLWIGKIGRELPADAVHDDLHEAPSPVPRRRL